MKIAEGCENMAGTMLKIDMRRGRILEKLRKKGTVSVSRLAEELRVTPVTIRSDLDALEAEGYLVRVQGGAVQKQEPASVVMARRRIEEKRAIAAAVAELVKDGDTLFINSGTTTLEVAAALRCRKRLNVVTNSTTVASELGTVQGFRVILLGGEINAQYGFTYGSDAQEQLGHYQADWAVLSLDGIGAECGLTTYHAEEATINRMMIARSKRTLAAADHFKVGRAGFFRFQEAAPHIILVTDGKASDEACRELKDLGVNIIVAK